MTHALPFDRLARSLPQKQQPKVDCNSAARQFSNFASNVSNYAGGAALVFGALGAEPVAGILGGAALLADGANALAGVYIGRTEGDYGPLGSSFTGAALGAVAGVGVKGFGGSSSTPFSGVRVNIAPSNAQVEAGKYAGSLVGGALGQQVCN